MTFAKFLESSILHFFHIWDWKKSFESISVLFLVDLGTHPPAASHCGRHMWIVRPAEKHNIRKENFNFWTLVGINIKLSIVRGILEGENVVVSAPLELVPPSFGETAAAHPDDPVLHHTLHRRRHRTKVCRGKDRHWSQEGPSLRSDRLLPDCELSNWSSTFHSIVNCVNYTLWLDVWVSNSVVFPTDFVIHSKICKYEFSRHLWSADGT